MPTSRVVVVGAGSAGCVVAARLSEHPGLDVLLLEAGPDGTPTGSTSANFLWALAEPGRLWDGWEAIPVPGAAAKPYLRGRGLGGSSAVNGLVGLWGTGDDAVAWVTAGAVGWDEPGLAPWRRRVMQQAPLRRPELASWSPFEQRLAQAALDLGYPWCQDHNRPGAWGIGPAPLTVANDRRCSAVEAYLVPARRRPNLDVRGDVVVDRVVLAGNRAVGVRTASGEEIWADDVVLTCGAIATPGVLLRSGIDRPGVGRNLAEHASAAVSLALAPAGRRDDPSLPVINSLVRYSSGLAGAGQLDMQLLPVAATGLDAEGLAVGSLQAAVMETFSRGRLTLRSEDPLDPPVIELALLADGRDRERLRDGMRRIFALVGRPEVAPLIEGVFVDELGTPLETKVSDEALDAWLTSHVGDYVHAAGTCRMGRPDDPLAVADPSGRVIGHEHLWIADASLLPALPRANPHLTIMLIGEKVAGAMASIQLQ